MEDIKVGDYVRSENGGIGKVISFFGETGIETNNEHFGKGWDGEDVNKTYKQEIIKHSKNIIDLIEVGDIIEIQTGLYNIYKIIIEDEDKLISIKESLKNWTLKTIVTKEQFAQIKYKVEG